MKKIDLDSILKIIILLGFSTFFIKIIWNGEIGLYVHPRIIPFVVVSSISLILVALFKIPEIFKIKKTRKNIFSYLFFLIPLLMAFTINAQVMSSNIAPKDNDNKNFTDKTKVSENRIIIESENFLDFINGNIKNYDLYKNKEIEITGFIYRNSEIKSNEFSISRFMMTCCSADMQIVGVECTTLSNVEYENDTWVKAIGTLQLEEIRGEKVVVLKVSNLEKINPPKNQYVYPY